MALLRCPYLGGEVELSDERREHIVRKHPELFPEHYDRIAETVADPDEVRRDDRFLGTRVFSRWFEAVRGGKFVVAVVVSDPEPAVRHWIVTAYVARKLSRGVVEWKRT